MGGVLYLPRVRRRPRRSALETVAALSERGGIIVQVWGTAKGGSPWKKLVVPDPPGAPSVSHQVGKKPSRFIHLKMENGP